MDKLTPRIIDYIADQYGILNGELVYGNRSRKYSEPRQIAAYCLYKFAGLSYKRIAKILNKKSHRTIIYSVSKVDEWRKSPILNRKAVDCINYILDSINKQYE